MRREAKKHALNFAIWSKLSTFLCLSASSFLLPVSAQLLLCSLFETLDDVHPRP